MEAKVTSDSCLPDTYTSDEWALIFVGANGHEIILASSIGISEDVANSSPYPEDLGIDLPEDFDLTPGAYLWTGLCSLGKTSGMIEYDGRWKPLAYCDMAHWLEKHDDATSA